MADRVARLLGVEAESSSRGLLRQLGRHHDVDHHVEIAPLAGPPQVRHALAPQLDLGVRLVPALPLAMRDDREVAELELGAQGRVAACTLADRPRSTRPASCGRWLSILISWDILKPSPTSRGPPTGIPCYARLALTPNFADEAIRRDVKLSHG